MAEEIIITVEEFRAMFPQWADATTYPDILIENFLAQAPAFIQPYDSCFLQLRPKVRKLAMMNCAAHLMTIWLNATQNGTSGTGTSGIVSETTIGEVSVSMVVPPTQKEYLFYFNQTDWGKAYLNMLRARVPLGVYYGGSDQRVFIGNNK